MCWFDKAELEIHGWKSVVQLRKPKENVKENFKDFIENFIAYVYDCKDVLESHIGEKEEEGSIHIHDALLIQNLPIKDNADE